MACAAILGIALTCLLISLFLLVRHHQHAKRMHEHSIMLDDDAPSPPPELTLRACLKCDIGCWSMVMVALCLVTLLVGFGACVVEGPKLIVDPANATNVSVNVSD